MVGYFLDSFENFEKVCNMFVTFCSCYVYFCLWLCLFMNPLHIACKTFFSGHLQRPFRVKLCYGFWWWATNCKSFMMIWLKKNVSVSLCEDWQSWDQWIWWHIVIMITVYWCVEYFLTCVWKFNHFNFKSLPIFSILQTTRLYPFVSKKF